MTHYETHYRGIDPKTKREGWVVYHSTKLTSKHEELRAEYGSAYTIRYMDTNKDRTVIQATIIHPSRESLVMGKPDTIFVVGRQVNL